MFLIAILAWSKGGFPSVLTRIKPIMLGQKSFSGSLHAPITQTPYESRGQWRTPCAGRRATLRLIQIHHGVVSFLRSIAHFSANPGSDSPFGEVNLVWAGVLLPVSVGKGGEGVQGLQDSNDVA
jgi:hypothetical protein